MESNLLVCCLTGIKWDKLSWSIGCLLIFCFNTRVKRLPWKCDPQIILAFHPSYTALFRKSRTWYDVAADRNFTCADMSHYYWCQCKWPRKFLKMCVQGSIHLLMEITYIETKSLPVTSIYCQIKIIKCGPPRLLLVDLGLKLGYESRWRIMLHLNSEAGSLDVCMLTPNVSQDDPSNKCWLFPATCSTWGDSLQPWVSHNPLWAH